MIGNKKNSPAHQLETYNFIKHLKDIRRRVNFYLLYDLFKYQEINLITELLN